MERGDVPELAVTAVFPSGLRTNPNGCGATVTVFPYGRMKRPFGKTVRPDLSMETGKFSAGARITQDWLDRLVQENPMAPSRSKNQKAWRSIINKGFRIMKTGNRNVKPKKTESFFPGVKSGLNLLSEFRPFCQLALPSWAVF